MPDEPYTGPERRSQPLADVADELNTSVVKLRDSVRDLTHYGRRNRQLIYITAVSIVLVVLLGVALAFVAVDARQASQRAEDASSLARRNTENARLTCEAGNEARRLQIQLWTYVLDLSSSRPNLTVGQRQQIAQFRRYLATTYAPRDCDASTPTVKPPTSTPTR